MFLKSKQEIGATLKELRQASKYTQKELGLKLDTTQQTIARWERGEAQPDVDTFFHLCDIFGVKDILGTFGFRDLSSAVSSLDSVGSREIDSIYDALNSSGQKELCRYGQYLGQQEEYRVVDPPVRRRPARVIPLLGSSFAAGTPETPGDLFIQDYETTDPRAEFAIRVNGDSMEPVLPDGSIALGIKRVPSDGDLGAFWLDGGFLVKQFCSDSQGNVYLFSLNRAREDADETIMHDSGRDLRCVGTILSDRRHPLP